MSLMTNYADTSRAKVHINMHQWDGVFRLRQIYFYLAEHRLELYQAFGLLVLLVWFLFNLWILRDWFFPQWFPPIYTESGLRKADLDQKTQELVRRVRMSNAFELTASIGAGEIARGKADWKQQQQKNSLIQQNPLMIDLINANRSAIGVSSTGAPLPAGFDFDNQARRHSVALFTVENVP